MRRRRRSASRRRTAQLSDEEKDRIKKAQDAYSLAEGPVDKYAAKLLKDMDGGGALAFQ